MYKFCSKPRVAYKYEDIETDFNNFDQKISAIIIDANVDQPDYQKLFDNLTKLSNYDMTIYINNINAINYKKFTNIDYNINRVQLIFNSKLSERKRIEIMSHKYNFNLDRDLLYIVNEFKDLQDQYIVIDACVGYNNNKLIIDAFELFDIKVDCVNLHVCETHIRNKWIELLSSNNIKSLCINDNNFDKIKEIMNNRLQNQFNNLSISFNQIIFNFDEEFVNLSVNCTKKLYIRMPHILSDDIKQQYIDAFSKYDNQLDWTLVTR